jgi:hypothetical protein
LAPNSSTSLTRPGLVHRVLQAQARFGRDQARDLVQALADDGGRLLQDAGALGPRELRLERLRGVERLPHLLQRGLGHAAEPLARRRIEDRDDAVAVAAVADTPAGDAHAVQRLVADEVGDGGHRRLTARG